MGKLAEKILGIDPGDLVEKIGDAFDKNFTSEEEKLEAKNKLLEKVTSLVSSLDAHRSKLLQMDLSGNWLQRSWRPLVMLSFAFIVMYTYFIQPAFFPNAVSVTEIIVPEFWQLLKIGMGGYMIGRSTEKIAKNVSENIGTGKRKNTT